MKDNRLNIIIKSAVVFLALSVVFCVCAVIFTGTDRPSMSEEAIKIAGTESLGSSEPPIEEPAAEEAAPRRIIVLDAGHGKPSSEMTDEEKAAEGYIYNEVTDGWGEWRHYKDGTFGEDCYGSECTLTAPRGGSCWYPLGSGDRETEPEINLNNALAAKRYLEGMGYEVRMTRDTNGQNPSMNKRVSYCFPDNDISQNPDAALYVCIHSNAGGGSCTSYIELEDEYRQSLIPPDYITKSNEAGGIINGKIAAATGLGENGPIKNEGYLILFNKCPVPIAYLEIGYYDNASDLEILQASSDAIGQAIAEGVEQYMSIYQ